MKRNNIHIVGGGIIGLCAAWYLNEAGVKVTVVDKNDFTEGTSYGNAGMVVPSHFVPMATPGVIAQGLKWLLDAKSPFYVKPRLNGDLIAWLWHFYRAANPMQVNRAIPVLLAFNEWSKALYKELADNPVFDFNYEEKGLLMLYRTKKQAHEEAEMAALAQRQGIDAVLLDESQAKALEPEMDLDVLGGLYFKGDAHLYPNQLMRQMVTQLKQKDVQFISNFSVKDFKKEGNRITAIFDENHQGIAVQHLLVASGAWTGQLLKKAGIKIHLQDGKGYSITLKKPRVRPRIPTILTESKVAITPMGDDLRIGGTLEISGLSPKINQKRVEGILESVPKYYKNFPVLNPQASDIWKGFRPCTPDGLPYIGPSKNIQNLNVATGHGMMGLSLGAATGKLVAQQLTQETRTVSDELFDLDRF